MHVHVCACGVSACGVFLFMIFLPHYNANSRKDSTFVIYFSIPRAKNNARHMVDSQNKFKN